jgi:hypothetical protein
MRQYMVVKPTEDLIRIYNDYDLATNTNVDQLKERVFQILSELKAGNDELRKAVLKLRDLVTVVSAPSMIPRSRVAGEWSNQLVVSLTFPDPESIALLRDFVIPRLGEQTRDGTAIVNIGADPRGHLCGPCPAAPARPFGNRERIRKMMGVEELRARKLKGRGVNVVIFDEGLDGAALNALRPKSFGGGLVRGPGKPGSVLPSGATRVDPGTASTTSHGMMMARNILDIAPDVKLFDVPLIPPRISRPHIFASKAHAIYQAALDEISRLRKGRPDEAWILVNAWAIFDRKDEEPKGDYTLNGHDKRVTSSGVTQHVIGHPLNKLMDDAVSQKIDVVFGAGNCGQFAASGRCGQHDRGEGRSIWGANAHPAVLTVGAVSANAEWLGYSSQGPAPWGGAKKPDICAPSHFSEDNDPSMVNAGTSAATGLAAGVIAAIRGRAAWRPNKLSPTELKTKINDTARGPNGTWNSRMGNGVLNTRALLSALEQKA